MPADIVGGQCLASWMVPKIIHTKPPTSNNSPTVIRQSQWPADKKRRNGKKNSVWATKIWQGVAI